MKHTEDLRQEKTFKIAMAGDEAVVLTEDLPLEENIKVLVTGDAATVLYVPEGHGLARAFSHAPDTPDFEGVLARALAAAGPGPVVALNNGADQSFRREDKIPAMSTFDLPRFLRRKLELAFPDLPYRACLRERAANTDDGALPSYLAGALTPTKNLEQVLNAFRAGGIAAAGLGSAPVEAADLAGELAEKIFGGGSAAAPRARWAVLLGQHESGTLRQVVVRDGNLALTRATETPKSALAGPAWAEEARREFGGTLGYLSRFGYAPGQGLDVIIICGEEEKRHLGPREIPATNLRCLTAAEALERLGCGTLKPEGVSMPSADALYAGWLMRRGRLRLPFLGAGFRLCAEQEHGHIDTRDDAGMMYRNGESVPRGDEGIIKWFRKRAERGISVARYVVGTMYEKGEFVPKDLAEAAKWYRLAAEQGETEAQFKLAGMYRAGEGVAKDEAEAMKWCRRAADQGSPDAQALLGEACLTGQGMAADDVEACFWLGLASRIAGRVVGNREAAEKRLSPEQKAAVEKRIAAWKPAAAPFPAVSA